MPRVWAPLVLLPTWLVMVACSPHSLRIGKRCPCGTLGAAQPWAMPLLYPGVCQAHLTLHCPPEFGWGRGGSGGAADRPTAVICSSCLAPLVMKLKILISVSCSL